jgi:hypothetical protein
MSNKNLGSNVLGGPFNGYSAKQTINNYKDSEQTTLRRILRSGWNTQNASGTINSKKRVITPFRAVNNAGDFLSRKNYSCGGPNPTNASRPGYKRNIGSMWSNCDNTGVPAASCNGKYVYDSSDYTRFRKEQAGNRNYNDLKFGGDQSHGSYVNSMAVVK